MFTGDLRGSRRFSLQYLWKRSVRITKKPYTPQKERLCILWGNPVIFTDCGEILMDTDDRRPTGEEIAFTVQPKINSHSQIFRYGQSISCLPHRPKFSDFFDICLHWVSVVCAHGHRNAPSK